MIQPLEAPPVAQTHPARGVATLRGLALVVEWLVLAIVLVLPLDIYFVLPGGSGGVFLSQVVAVEALVVLLVGLLLARLWHRPAAWPVTWRGVAPLLLLLAAAALAAVTAAARAPAVRECGKLAFYLALFLLACAVRGRSGVRQHVLALLTLGFVGVLVFGLIDITPGAPDFAQSLLNVQHVTSTLPGTSIARAASTFRYPDELNAYLLLMLPLLVAGAARASGWSERVAFGVLAALGSVLLVLTYTRSAPIICLLIAPVLLYLLGGRRLALIGALIGAVVVAGVALRGGHFTTRMLSLLSGADAQYGNRLEIWRWALNAFTHRPLTGVGPRNLQFFPGAPWADQFRGRREDNAENMYLNTLAEMGLLGLLAMLACLVGAGRRIARGLRDGTTFDRMWHIGLLTGLLAVLLDGVVHPTLASGQVTGLLCILVGLSGPGIVTPMAAPSVRAPASASVLRRTSAPSQEAVAEAPMHAHHVGLLTRLDARIVFLVNSPGLGGAERHALHLAADLLARGADVLVVCPPGAPLLAELADQGIPSRAVPLGMSLGRWRGYLGTAAYINPFSRDVFNRAVVALASETPSIFVCPFLREQLLAARFNRRRGLRTVWMMHAPLHYRPHRVLLRWIFVRRARAASAIVTVSRGLADALVADGLDRAWLRVVPNAVMSVPPETSPATLAAALAARPLDIAVVSRLTRGKGVQHLIAAMPAILAAQPDARLLIAGAGRYERALRAQAQRLTLGDRVAFLGQVPDVEWLLESARVFVCPSTDAGEVLPTAVLEALSRGVPVVATDVGSMAEVIQDGQTGLLVAGGDRAALAEAVTRLLADPPRAAELASAGQALVRTWYTFERAGLAFLHVLRLIEEASAPARPLEPPADRVAPKAEVAPVEVSATSGTLQAVQRTRFLRTTVVLFASKVLTALATSLWTILAARALLPRAYGNLMLAAGIIELGAVITDAGLTTVATRELANAAYEQAQSLVGAIVAIKLALGLVATGAIAAIALAVPMEADARSVLIVLGPSLFFVSLNSLTLVFRARVSAWQVLGVALLGALVTTYGTVFVYLGIPTIRHFAEVRLLAALASGSLALALVLARYRPRPRLDGAVIRGLLLAALPLGIALALNIAYYRIDVPLLAILRGSTQVATYTAAYRILDVITLLPGAAAAMALPLMSGIARRNERHLAVFVTQYLEIAVACGLLIGLVITLFGNTLLAFLYAGKYAASGPTLTVLGWVGAATFITNVFAPLAIVLDRQRTFLVMAGLGLVVNVALNLALIPLWGPSGAATATLLTEIVVTVPLAWIAYQRLWLRFVTRPVVAVVVATAVALGVGLLPHAHGADVALKLGAVALWGALVIVLAPRWVRSLLTAATNRDQIGDSLARGTSPLEVPTTGEGTS